MRHPKTSRSHRNIVVLPNTSAGSSVAMVGSKNRSMACCACAHVSREHVWSHGSGREGRGKASQRQVAADDERPTSGRLSVPSQTLPAASRLAHLLPAAEGRVRLGRRNPQDCFVGMQDQHGGHCFTVPVRQPRVRHEVLGKHVENGPAACRGKRC